VTDDVRNANELHGEPVVVATHADRGEAEVTVAHLRASGITAQIVDEVEGGTVPMDGEPGVAVMVPANDAEAARQVLA
jgi:hypothetical protein